MKAKLAYSSITYIQTPSPSPSPCQMAGAAVRKATETLVKAAQQAAVNVEEESAGPSVSVSVYIVHSTIDTVLQRGRGLYMYL